VVDNLQKIRELTVQANNAPLSDGDRAAIASELRERLEALRSVANTTDVDGRHLFAGFNEATVPFIGPGGNVVYNGDQVSAQRAGERDARFVALQLRADVFQRIPTGNGTFTLTAGAANTGNGVLGAGTVVDPTAWDPDNYTIRSSRRRPTRFATARPRSSPPGTYAAGQAIRSAASPCRSMVRRRPAIRSLPRRARAATSSRR
jgi:flagellar hook-associated protein 3 FlgL